MLFLDVMSNSISELVLPKYVVIWYKMRKEARAKAASPCAFHALQTQYKVLT